MGWFMEDILQYKSVYSATLDRAEIGYQSQPPRLERFINRFNNLIKQRAQKISQDNI
jgi:hypothetical protein